MVIASRLNKFEHEVDQLSVEEYARWVAFFKIQDEAEKKAAEKAKRGRRG